MIITKQSNKSQTHGGKCNVQRPPTSFSYVTSTNAGISLNNFLTFSFNHYARLA